MTEVNDESTTSKARDPSQSGIETMPSMRRGDGDTEGETLDLLAAVRTAHDDRYHRVEQRASGGMGSVYVARDAPLARTLALKVHHDHLAAGHQAVVHVDVDGLAHLAVQLHHRAAAQLQKLADLHGGLAQHRRDLDRRLPAGG